MNDTSVTPVSNITQDNATPAAGAKPIEVTDATFEKEVMEASKTMPVFLDVHAEWCEPCKAIAPIVEKFATQDFAGKVKFVKLDADVNPEIIQKYGIRSIPTLMVFKDATVKVQQAGALGEPMMKDFINTYAFGTAGASVPMPMAA
ncbi:MAG: thioredoxin family protein [Candidatus Dojkabacteria bacterium]